MKNLIKPSATLFLLAAVILNTLSADDLADDTARRRQLLAERMGSGITLVSGQAISRNRTTDNKFFYYLTGITDSQAVLLLTAGEKAQTVLFTRNGQGTDQANGKGIKYLPLKDLSRTMLQFSRSQERLFISFAGLDLLNRLGGNSNPFSRCREMINLDPYLTGMRAIKSPYEIKLLERAIDITAASLVEVFRAAAPGMKEYDLAAILEYSMRRRGSPGPTFLQAASGPNSTFIHFGAGDRALHKGDMIVFDVGAEYENYTADISRSIPADGRFTREQKEIYSLVLRAQKTAIEQMKSGIPFSEPPRAAEEVLMAGLQKLGLVTDVNSRWQRRLFIQHGFYHYIGLDIHDVWYYARSGAESIYREGMVMTMEPGLYFPADMLKQKPRRLRISDEEFQAFARKITPIYNKYTNIGVRIEDDVLITAEGNRILSARVPKEIKDIERLMKEKSPHNKLMPVMDPTSRIYRDGRK